MSGYRQNVSLILSRVMDDIGVNEECVMRRRRTNLIRENGVSLRLLQCKLTSHIFGSQTEGTTTAGLQSDLDALTVDENYKVINDWEDWVPGKCNLMMILDDVLRPGYCKLQLLRPDVPLPMDEVPNDSYMHDDKGRVLMKSTCFFGSAEGIVLHGPAVNLVEPRFKDYDIVTAFPSLTLSNQCTDWSSRLRPFNWPPPELVEYIENTRCFVVPYVHSDKGRPNLDWRISSSLAERCLMFSLNITQIRCYVLLKMIVKTFIEPNVSDVISSYICKTLLFHCLERTSRGFWIEENLVLCVNHVLLYMLAAVHKRDCPNYFNESSNLLFGKIDGDIQDQLMTRIREVVKSDGRFLLKIGFDDLSCRLTRYITDRNLMLSFDENEEKRVDFCVNQELKKCMNFRTEYFSILLNIVSNHISKDRILPTLMDLIKSGGLQGRAAVLNLPFICSYLATVDACECILQGQDISPRTLSVYRLSLGSDAAASRLKYASFLYCTDQFEGALSVLHDLERTLTPHKVVQFCTCTGKAGHITDTFIEENRQNTFHSTSNISLCVAFTRDEIQCCPRELHFEFDRSTDEDRLHRRGDRKTWMNKAVLDSLPYLYYMQYMVSRHLGLQDMQYRALHNLESRVCSRERLGHRETAYNVLGQCLELENNMDRALMHYRMSLQVRPRNNAALLHLTRLGFDVSTRDTK